MTTLSDERADDKRKAREQDERDLADGTKTREQLRRERSAFVFPRVRVRLDLVEKFT